MPSEMASEWRAASELGATMAAGLFKGDGTMLEVSEEDVLRRMGFVGSRISLVAKCGSCVADLLMDGDRVVSSDENDEKRLKKRMESGAGGGWGGGLPVCNVVQARVASLLSLLLFFTIVDDRTLCFFLRMCTCFR